MKIFSILFLFSASICGSEITLRDQLSQAVVGSYLVTEQNKTYTFLHIYEKKGERLALEEVTISGESFRPQQLSWKAWFESGAPGNTAWTLSQINLRTGKVEEVFSVTHSGWVEINHSDSFLTTLLNLRFNEVGPAERRKIGLPPGYGKPDLRPLWHPRLVVGGMMVANIPFNAWKARWPADGSELAWKMIEVYLPSQAQTTSIPQYPMYFPYWLEVEGKLGSAKIRVVDSGMEARSPQKRFPHKKPQVMGPGKWVNESFVIELKNPSHITDLMVLAEECDTVFGKSFPIPAQVTDNEQLTTITLKKEDLSKIVECDSYRFVITSQEDSSFALEVNSSPCLSTK